MKLKPELIIFLSILFTEFVKSEENDGSDLKSDGNSKNEKIAENLELISNEELMANNIQQPEIIKKNTFIDDVIAAALGNIDETTEILNEASNSCDEPPK